MQSVMQSVGSPDFISKQYALREELQQQLHGSDRAIR